jgi:hypothetical protein
MGTPAGEEAKLESMEETGSPAVTGEGGLEESDVLSSISSTADREQLLTSSLAESLNCVTKAQLWKF